MLDIGSRMRNQPAPPHIIFEGLVRPDRDPRRPWLHLLHDEQRPKVLREVPNDLVVWSSIWPRRADAVIRFDLAPAGGGTDLRWTLSVDEPAPDDSLTGHLRKRMNQIVNADFRYSFGQ